MIPDTPTPNIFPLGRPWSVTAFHKPALVAALFLFDKVFLPDFYGLAIAPSLHKSEAVFSLYLARMIDEEFGPDDIYSDRYAELFFSHNEISLQAIKEAHVRYGLLLLLSDCQTSLHVHNIDGYLLHFVRDTAYQFQRRGCTVLPCYPSEHSYVADFPGGPFLAYQAALNNIPIPSGTDVSLDQLVAFRSDRDALRKYRDLRLWLEHGLSADSVAHATDIIAQKIEDYEWSLTKHGLKTVTGSLSRILNFKTATLSAAAATAGDVLAGPIGAAAAAGAVLMSHALVSITETLIEYEETRRGPNREIAIIYDIKKRLAP